MIKSHSKSTCLDFWALRSLPSICTSVFTTGPHRVPVLQQLLESESVSPPLLFLCFKILRKYLGFLEIPYIGLFFFFFFKFLQDTPWTLWALGCAEPWLALSGRLWLLTQPLPCFRLYISSPGSVSVLPSFPIFSMTPEVLCSQ